LKTYTGNARNAHGWYKDILAAFSIQTLVTLVENMTVEIVITHFVKRNT